MDHQDLSSSKTYLNKSATPVLTAVALDEHQSTKNII